MSDMRIRSWFRLLLALFFAHLLLVAQTTDVIGPITSALRSGQFDEALQLLQPELQRSPRNAQLWALDGIALSGKGDKKNALAAFRHALGISPDYLPALEGAAQIEYESGDKDAVSLLQHILQLRPNESTSHAMLAALAYRSGDCAAAVPHFEQSGSRLDDQPVALQEYGTCLVRMKEFEKAIGVFGRALAGSNEDAGARYRMASVQMMAHHPQDALETLQPILRTSNARVNTDVLELASSAYEAAGNTPEAVRVLRRAIVADPHNVDLYLDFANISIDHQSYEVGVDMINAGLRAEPNAAPLYLARGILYVQLAQFDKAEADFARADAIDPGHSIGSAAEGLAAVQKNDPKQALATVRAKLAKKPNDPFLLYLQADILLQPGPEPGSADFREAMLSAKKAVSLGPSLGAAHDVLAKLYLQAGQNDAAVEQSRKALAIDAKDQTALYHLIQGLRKGGQQKEEIPELLKRLADLRMEGTKQEAEHNRYKLVEQETPPVKDERP
jgi:tetratricopeptide (TPR) repeat protein